MRVIVFGSINLDLIARVDNIPRAGETRLGQMLVTNPGGKGANQALASRRMGAETLMLGLVGDDAFAMQALQLLRQDGVDLHYIGVSRELSTGLAMITVDEQGQNAIVVISGANYGVGSKTLSDLESVLTANDIVLLQAELPMDVTERALMIAQSKGAMVMWDPAPASPGFPHRMFHAEIVMPNQGEAELILNCRITDVRTAKHAARELHQKGAGCAVIKLGDQGVVWATDRGVFYLPAETVKAVDAVGAGDAFAGALAARIAAGDNLAEAMRIANKAAALSTTHVGAQPSFPWRDDVMNLG
ncbi:MAG: ribokinase [Firmicutes bacterium]|nr:ribokinase [Bacillota bacterium]